MLKKLQVVWAAGREGISPTKFNDVNSLEEWISFLGIGKRLWAVGYSVSTLYSLLLEKLTDHSIANLLKVRFRTAQPTKLEELDEFMREVKFENSVKPVAAVSQQKMIKCYNCNKMGHFARNCFKQCTLCSARHQRRHCPKFSKNEFSPSLDQWAVLLGCRRWLSKLLIK